MKANVLKHVPESYVKSQMAVQEGINKNKKIKNSTIFYYILINLYFIVANDLQIKWKNIRKNYTKSDLKSAKNLESSNYYLFD